jgi:ABC-type lipoprotein release transport system permease subunit
MEKIFEINILTASFAGVVLGVLNGFISGFFIVKNIDRENKNFLKASFFLSYINFCF